MSWDFCGNIYSISPKKTRKAASTKNGYMTFYLVRGYDEYLIFSVMDSANPNLEQWRKRKIYSATPLIFDEVTFTRERMRLLDHWMDFFFSQPVFT